MHAKELIREINKSKRFLPADLNDVEVGIFEDNFNETSFYFFQDGEILHKFTINRNKR